MDNVEISTVRNRFSKRYTKKSFLSNRDCIDQSQKGAKLKEPFPLFSNFYHQYNFRSFIEAGMIRFLKRYIPKMSNHEQCTGYTYKCKERTKTTIPFSFSGFYEMRNLFGYHHKQ